MISKSLISDLLINGVGVTLMHSLWQALTIALALKILLLVIPRNQVQLKYWLSVTALTAIVFWTGYTFCQEVLPVTEYSSSSEVGIVEMMTGSQIQLSEISNVTAFKTSLDQWLMKLQPYMDTMVVIWMVGVIFFLIRLQGSMIYLKRLKVTGTRPVSSAWQSKVQELSNRLGISTKVRVVESTLAEIPMVIGHLKPVILLPIGMLTGFTIKEVEAILAHELAHIKRFDYLINIVQTVVESLLFFNPAVWLISHSIRKHREHCCDDIAVKYCGNQLEYANALSNLGAWSLKTPALGMGLFKNKNELLMRIKRLVYPQVGNRTLKEKLVPGIVLLLTVVCLSWYSYRVQAQLIPVATPSGSSISEFEPLDQVQVKDTIPAPAEGEKEIPPMDPVQDQGFEIDDYQIESNVDLNIDLDIPEMVEIESFVLPYLQNIEDLTVLAMPDIDVEEVVDLSMMTMPDIAIALDPEVYIEIAELVDVEHLKDVVKDIHIILDDTTRERIQKALEAQREALERARVEQSEALEKAREHLKQSLEAERPEDLTEEEWEMAKRQIKQAERSLEQAMKQSARALDRALLEREYGWHEQVERIARNNHVREEMMHRYRGQIDRAREHNEQARERNERARAKVYRYGGKSDGNQYQRFRSFNYSGKESKLRDKLLEDGLIDNYNSDIALSFTRNQIKINGVKLEGEVKQKYRELLDDMYGKNSTGELEFND